jgi:ADP-ribosylation factor protein 1
MGNALSWLFSWAVQQERKQLLMVGPPGGGKTTILYKTKLGEVNHFVLPTTAEEEKLQVASLQLKEVLLKNIRFGAFDLPAEESTCEEALIFARSRYAPVHALIFVVDASELSSGENIYGESSQASAKARLQQLLRHFPSIPLLVFAHKCDLPNALTASVTAERLELLSLQRAWHIEASAGNTGQGLYEGLDWLSNQITPE